MDRRNSAGIPTKRKAQPYLLLSPPRSERDLGFCFVLLLTGISFFVWFVVFFFSRKSLAKKPVQLLSVKAAFLPVVPYKSLEGSKLNEQWRNKVQLPRPRAGKCFPSQCATHLSLTSQHWRTHSAVRTQDKAASSATCQLGALGAGNPKAFSQRSDLTCHPCRAQRKMVQGSPSVLQLCWAHMCKPRHPPSSLMLPSCHQEPRWCCTQQ